MGTLEVEIFTARFTVRVDGNAPYLQALAAEVEARIQQIYATTPRISPLQAAIMAAYQYADETKQHHGNKDGNKDGSRPPARPDLQGNT
jgi:cell division protein ZapA (FtsZ GTPase activity inhibitor)